MQRGREHGLGPEQHTWLALVTRPATQIVYSFRHPTEVNKGPLKSGALARGCQVSLLALGVGRDRRRRVAGILPWAFLIDRRQGGRPNHRVSIGRGSHSLTHSLLVKTTH